MTIENKVVGLTLLGMEVLSMDRECVDAMDTCRRLGKDEMYDKLKRMHIKIQKMFSKLEEEGDAALKVYEESKKEK